MSADEERTRASYLVIRDNLSKHFQLIIEKNPLLLLLFSRCIFFLFLFNYAFF